jgi:biotin carboxyl carrier protein
MATVKLHNVSSSAINKASSQVDAAANSAYTAAYQSVLASQGIAGNQAGDPASAQAAADAATAASTKARQDAIAAGLSQMVGTAASAAPAPANVMGLNVPAQHKHLFEFGVGLAVTAGLAVVLIRAMHPKH